MYLGTGHGPKLRNELEDLSHPFAQPVRMSACRQPTGVFSSVIDLRRCDARHIAQYKAAKQHRGDIIFDLFIRAFSFLSLSVGFVGQGKDRKMIGMAPKYYSGSVVRGQAADIRSGDQGAGLGGQEARKADPRVQRRDKPPPDCGL